jgi:hypothetical protein
VDALTMAELAFPIFVESGSITISLGHTGQTIRQRDTALCHLAHGRRAACVDG